MTRKLSSAIMTAALLAMATWSLGCKPTSKEQAAPAPSAYPARPNVPAPAFKVFHQDAKGTFTLVTKADATDAEIEALIWQLRDAAHAHSFDKLGISEAAVDARAPRSWFHIYRGSECAAEKYASGPPPCGGSYHAAGDYTLGSDTHRDWDDGLLLHGGTETPLWDSDAPYTTASKP